MSGDTEGLPVVLPEAMAAGCPVVGTSVGGIPDIVVSGRTGLVVEPRSPEALAAAINQLLDSPAEAQRMGSLARRWVRRKFDWRQVAKSYADVLTQAVRDGNGKRGATQGCQSEVMRCERGGSNGCDG
jgi:phosphatidylinositol alpha-1,6-mannosyltransferase